MKLFTILYLTAVSLVVIQGVLAFLDGYYSEEQMFREHPGRAGWSFLQHGGMWADVTVGALVFAFIVSKFRLPYLKWPGIVSLVVSVVIVGAALHIYNKGGLRTPEAHTHDGYTTAAGWVHALFALGLIWVSLMFYFTPVQPKPDTLDVVLISSLLTVLFVMGVIKWSPSWYFEKPVIIQVVVEIGLVWLAAIRLIR